MIPCLEKGRHGQPANFQVGPDQDGLRVTIQEGGDSRSNLLSRAASFLVMIRMACALAGFSLREIGEALMLMADEEEEFAVRKGAA